MTLRECFRFLLLLSLTLLSATVTSLAAPPAGCPVVSIDPYPLSKFHIAMTYEAGVASTKENTDGPDPIDYPPNTQLTILKAGEKRVPTSENCLIVYNIQHVKTAPHKSIQPQIKLLKKFLADRPTKLPRAESGSGTFEGEVGLPDYPASDCTQLFQRKVRYLDTPWGSGVGYITTFAQDVGPITNSDLVYIFQGVTKDGKNYVSVNIHIRHPELLNSYDEVPAKSKTEKGVVAFNTGALQLLSKQPDSAFKPDLGSIEKWISSLKIQ